MNLWLQTEHTECFTPICAESSSPLGHLLPSGPRDEPWPCSLQRVDHENRTPFWIQLLRDCSGPCQPPQSATSTPPPPQGVHALLCKSNHSYPHPPPPPLSLFCKCPLPHHFTYTLQPLSSGDCPGSNCGFCASSSPPLPQRSRTPLSAVII